MHCRAFLTLPRFPGVATSCFTEHKRGAQTCRAHPSFRKDGLWLDWACFQLRQEAGGAPQEALAQAWHFIDLRSPAIVSGACEGNKPLDLRSLFPGWLDEMITGSCCAVTTPVRDAPKRLAASGAVPQLRHGEAAGDKHKRQHGEKSMALKAGRGAGKLCFMAVDSARGPAMVTESQERREGDS